MKSRKEFRKSRGISEDKYLFYIDAGQDVNQVKFSFKSIKDGLQTFFSSSDVSKINPDHFEIFVFVPSNVNLFRYRMSEKKWEAN